MAKTKLTPEVIQIITEAIKAGATDKEAYTAGGIGKSSFYQALSDNLDFSETIKNAREERTKIRLKAIQDAAESGLIVLLRGCEYDETTTETKRDTNGQEYTQTKIVHKKVLPNATAVLFALCNRDPSRWQNRVTGEIKQEIQTESKQTIDVSKVSDATLKQLVDELSTELLTAPLP